MTYILNNIAANTALLNLENTVMNLQNVQNQISTGLRVSSAADNAAYFSIATVLRSDSNALSTVSDTLNLGNSSLSVASTALSQVQTTLSDIKSLLVEASQPNADMAVIQQSISQDQAQLKSVASAANLNGQNFLSVNSSAANFNPTLSFVSSYSRNSTGAISIGYINVNTAKSALFDTGTSTAATVGSSLSSSTASVVAASVGLTGGAFYSPTVVNTDPNGLQSFEIGTVDPTNVTTAANNLFLNKISVNSSTAITAVAVTQGTAGNGLGGLALAAGDTLGGIAQGHAANAAEPAGVTAPTVAGNTLTFYVINNNSTTAGMVEYDKVVLTGYTPPKGNGILDTVDATTQGSYTDANGNTTTSGVGTGFSIANMSVAGLTDSAADLATLNAYQKQVDAAISSVASAASTLGTAQSRIQAQSSFVTTLQTSINNGVGSLVDADLNVASTRLQALQVQQQLGVQSLSIANQSTQAILKLFQ